MSGWDGLQAWRTSNIAPKHKNQGLCKLGNSLNMDQYDHKNEQFIFIFIVYIQKINTYDDVYTSYLYVCVCITAQVGNNDTPSC
jgi:hypothetical protein